MTLTDRVNALQQFGYTIREASFLATVALHSGYFVMRQFSPKGGKVADQFASKVMDKQHATRKKFVSNASLYHLKSKTIYQAIQQENNRHRRMHDIGHVRLKVMGLDYVMAHPGFRFLPTEEEKLAYFCGERNIPKGVLPTKTYLGKGGHTERFFVDKFPVRMDPATGKVAFCFVDDSPILLLSFETWLTQYDALIREMGNAEVVFISTNPGNFEPARKLFWRQFSTMDRAHPTELLAYFELRKKLEAEQFRGASIATLDRFKKLRKAFSDAKFEDRYRTWWKGAEAVEADTSLTFSVYHLEHSCRFYG